MKKKPPKYQKKLKLFLKNLRQNHKSTNNHILLLLSFQKNIKIFFCCPKNFFASILYPPSPPSPTLVVEFCWKNLGLDSLCPP